jgi:hypothetical protein
MLRVLCGGSWRYNAPSWVRATGREWDAVPYQYDNLGLRPIRLEAGP